MATKFADLTEAQKQKFKAQLEAFGISSNDIPPAITADGKARMNKDPELATVKTFTVEVKDLAQLKKLCGVPDSVFQQQGSDAHIPYPSKMPAERVKRLTTGRKQITEASLTADDRQAIKAAMTAYMLGNSSKVPQEYVGICNAVEFPTTLAVVATQDLTVSGPYPVTQSLVCGTITIEPQGYLQVEGDVSIQTQVLTVVGR